MMKCGIILLENIIRAIYIAVLKKQLEWKGDFMFGVNYHKLIKKNFKFLKDLGFKFVEYQNGPDLETVFTYQDVIIELHYYYGVDDKYNKDYYFDVVISKKGIRENLLKSIVIFGQEKIQDLVNKLVSANMENKIILYSQFIMNNYLLLLE